jgi:hypothetical protein
MPDLSRQAILDATCFDVNRSTAEELDHQSEQLTVGLVERAVTNADRSTVFALKKTMLRLAHRSSNTAERCCTGRVDQEGGVAVCCTAQRIAAQHSTAPGPAPAPAPAPAQHEKKRPNDANAENEHEGRVGVHSQRPIKPRLNNVSDGRSRQSARRNEAGDQVQCR